MNAPISGYMLYLSMVAIQKNLNQQLAENESAMQLMGEIHQTIKKIETVYLERIEALEKRLAILEDQSTGEF